MWLYYITDRKQFPGEAAEQRRRLLEKIAEASRWGVDYIQLREKDLTSRQLEELAHEAVATVRENQGAPTTSTEGTQFHRQSTRLLINSRTDIAIASRADGVHLPGNDLNPIEVRAILKKAVPGPPQHRPLIGISCHAVEEVRRAQTQGADLAVYGPVFEKVTAGEERRQGVGLNALRAACGLETGPTLAVFALGGVTLGNAQQCVQAGAVGVAGIRLFQENDLKVVVESLRNA